MLFNRDAERYIRLQSLILLGLYVIYIVAGYKTFNVWSQLDFFVDVNPLDVLYHPHGLRYLVTWPVLWASEYFEIHRNVVFSFVVAANLMIATLFTAAVQARISYQIEPRWQIWMYLFIPVFATLSFAMNGRLSYMMLGISMMMYAYTRWLDGVTHREPLAHSIKWFSINAVALVFLSVSSGCFTVGMLLVLAQAIMLAVLPGQSIVRRLVSCVLSVALMGIFVFLQYTFVQKNLGYYGGSIYAMALHGAGEFFMTGIYGREILATLVTVVVFISVRYLTNFSNMLSTTLCERYYLLITPVLVVIIASVVGMFGYSALLTGSTAAMILAIHSVGSMRGWPHIRVMALGEIFNKNSGLGAVSVRRKLVACAAALSSGILVLLVPDPQIPAKNLTSDSAYNWTLRWDKDYHTSIIGSMNPTIVASDADGNVFIVESQHRILRIDSNKKLSVYAGDLEAGDVLGVRSTARFNNIADIALDKQRNLYVADKGNNKIKKIDTDGHVSAILGSGKIGRFYSRCKPLECRITAPQSIHILPDNSLVVSAGLELIRLQHDGLPTQFLFLQESIKRADGTIIELP